MRHWLPRLLLIAACTQISLSLAQTGAADSRPGGAIRGLVIDPTGQPVPGAKVEAVVTPRPPKGSPRLWDADSSGHFSISPVPWGTYRIYAIKPGTGPYYSTWPFARDEPGPSVTVSPGAPDAEIMVSTGLEPARLAPIAVVDGATGRPITVTDPGSGDQLSNVSITLTRVEKNGAPGIGITINAPVAATKAAGIKVLVPAQVPVIAKIQSPGYADWYYPGGTDDKASAKPITLKPGEVFDLGNVLLRRVARP